MIRPSIVVLGALMFLAGCSDYYGDFDYVPKPAIASITTTQPQDTVATTWTSVEGVHNPDKSRGIPLSVEVHMQMENSAPDPLTFDPRSAVLTDGSLFNFAPCVGPPLRPITVPPGESATFVMFFPFANGQTPDQTKMTPLQLRWSLQLGTQTFPHTVNFVRIYPATYYGPYYGYAGAAPVFVTSTVVYVRR